MLAHSDCMLIRFDVFVFIGVCYSVAWLERLIIEVNFGMIELKIKKIFIH